MKASFLQWLKREEFDKVHTKKSLLRSSRFPRPASLSNKRLWHRCFPVNFAKFLRTPFFSEQLQWLLLFVGVYLWNRTFGGLQLYLKKRLYSAPICNPCPNLKSLLPRFVTFLLPFEIPKPSSICNPSCPDLQSLKPVLVCNPLFVPFCDPGKLFPKFSFFTILVMEFKHE